MTAPTRWPNSLHPVDLAALCDEVAPVLTGGRVQKVHGPTPDRLVLHLYAGGERHMLLIAIGPPLPRIHLLATAPENPEKPLEFVQRLRRELEGARLRAFAARTDERAVTLTFDTLVDGQPATRRLEIELFGRRSNVALIGDGERVLGLLDASPQRREGLHIGQPFAPPPPRPPSSAPQPTPFAWSKDAAPANADGPSTATEDSGALPRWSAFLSAQLEGQEEAHLAATERGRALIELRRRIKKERKLLENLEAELQDAGQGEALRARGERLKLALPSLPKGAREALLRDPLTGAEERLAIPLDQSPVEVMQALFDAAKKADRALPKVAQRIGGVEERVRALEAFAAELEAAASPLDFEPLRPRAVALGLLPKVAARTAAEVVHASKKKAVPPPRKPYRTYRSADGIEILVGRTSRDNDELTFQVGRGNDLWLHVADWPGSHVIVRCESEIPSETLLDAALLAAHYSKAPAGAKLEVSYTRRKHVHKFKGANTGQVQLAQRKSLRVRPDPDRLARLLSGPKDDGDDAAE